MKLLIDTDVGVDDAGALILALTHESSPEILAISTVFGNVDFVAQAVANASRILRLVGKTHIPIYAGAEGPLIPVKVLRSHSSAEYHGKDGLGDRPEVEPKLEPSDFTMAVPGVPAAIGLIKHINMHPNEVTLVCLGPLTNVALALKLDPSIGRKLKNLVLMGGNIHATGNVLSFVTSEYNFYKDPEAAHIVLEEIKSPITIVPWEAYLSHKVDQDFKEKFYCDRTVKSRFVKAITGLGLQILVEWNWNLSLCDEAAMAVALDPSIVTKSEKHVATVELCGVRTRGQVAIDWKNIDKTPTNVEFITSYDVDKAQKMLLKAIE